MAAHLLSMPKKMQTLQDDLEFFFRDMLYSTMRYVGSAVESFLSHSLVYPELPNNVPFKRPDIWEFWCPNSRIS